MTGLQQRREIARELRLADQVALRVVAAKVRQQVPLLPGLHALGHCPQPEAMGHVDDGSQHGHLLGTLQLAAYERLVDFQFIRRQLPQL